MRILRMVAVMALLTGPAYAQQLIQSFDSKTPQQKADEELKERSAREAAKKTPEANTGTSASVDAWGNIRSPDAARSPASKNAAAKNPAAKSAKTATSVKPQTQTGTDAN
jgi:hypothetical protein